MGGYHIFSPTDICFGDVKQIPKKGHQSQPLENTVVTGDCQDEPSFMGVVDKGVRSGGNWEMGI